MSFGHGEVPRICVYNRSNTQVSLDTLVQALQAYVDHYLKPVWGVEAELIASAPQPGAWGFVFLDDADAPGALAYHTEQDGLPFSKVFARTTLQNGGLLSVTASHELAEMLVDPGIQMMASHAGAGYAYEVCDAVEADALGFEVQGVMMSDFVYPSWFEDFRKPGSAQFSQNKSVSAPFQLASGGYISTWDGKDWKQVFGSTVKATQFAREDRRGHRSEYR